MSFRTCTLLMRCDDVHISVFCVTLSKSFYPNVFQLYLKQYVDCFKELQRQKVKNVHFLCAGPVLFQRPWGDKKVIILAMMAKY